MTRTSPLGARPAAGRHSQLRKGLLRSLAVLDGLQSSPPQIFLVLGKLMSLFPVEPWTLRPGSWASTTTLPRRGRGRGGTGRGRGAGRAGPPAPLGRPGLARPTPAQPRARRLPPAAAAERGGPSRHPRVLRRRGESQQVVEGVLGRWRTGAESDEGGWRCLRAGGGARHRGGTSLHLLVPRFSSSPPALWGLSRAPRRVQLLWGARLEQESRGS